MLVVNWSVLSRAARLCPGLLPKGPTHVITRTLQALHLVPAGGEILATTSIQAAYHDGRGSITVRGKVAIEAESSTSKSRGGKASRKGGDLIVITELPYQTNKVRSQLPGEMFPVAEHS